MEIVRTKKRTVRLISIIILLLFTLSGLGIYLFWEKLPYQNEAGRQLQKALATYGIEVTSLKVESVASDSALFSAIQLGTSPALKIGKLTARYTLGGLRNGRVNIVGIVGAAVKIYDNNGWKIGGLESLKLPAPPENAPGFSPFDSTAMQSTMPNGIVISDSSVQIDGKALQASATLESTYQNAPQPNLSIDLPTFSMALGKYLLNASSANVEATLNPEKKEWQGTLKAYKVLFSGLPREMPQMLLTGTFTASEANYSSNLTLNDAKSAHKANFLLSLPASDPKKGLLTIKSLQFPYAGGFIRTKSVKIPFAGDTPIKLALEFENVSLAELATLASGGKMQATGVISGTLPLTYYPDGKITLQEGSARAKESGTIIVSPDSLPGGDRKELDVVRTALQNFHYTTLSLQVVSGADEASTIQLKVEGNNPEAFNGKAVKLNVNLTGDIIPMIQQTLGSFNDVGSLLRSETK